MDFPDFDKNNYDSQWERFQNLLWYDKHLEMWLDISRIYFNDSDLKHLDEPFQHAFTALDLLEQGSTANKDENRQVGHYWLRSPSLSPTKEMADDIRAEIESIEQFGSDIIKGNIRSETGKPFTDVLWVGIGGSGLGPLLIINSLSETNKGLNFHFIDNIDAFGISNTLKELSPKLTTTLFITVSKSGGTPEPRIASQLVRSYVEKEGVNWPNQSIAITMKGSQLDLQASNENWLRRFDLPEWVGGRTSITGAVGLLPLSLIGRSGNEFLEGASKMDQLTRQRNILSNPAALLAASWFFAGNGKGKRDMVVLPYRDNLEVFSRYLQQLVMESLGKKLDRDNRIVNQGLSVFGNKGSTDQHAYVQQLRDGLDNFFATFIEVTEKNEDIPSDNGENPNDFLSGFLQGTREALSQGGKQSLTITMKRINEHSLGCLIALFERAVGLYGELINVNAYHQPGVEAGKLAAKDILVLQSSIEELISHDKYFSIEDIRISTNTKSSETIYWIMRHLSDGDKVFEVKGSWKEPNSLRFRRSPQINS